jgi:hypothetical protein
MSTIDPSSEIMSTMMAVLISIKAVEKHGLTATKRAVQGVLDWFELLEKQTEPKY